jgi:hypothetical protein
VRLGTPHDSPARQAPVRDDTARELTRRVPPVCVCCCCRPTSLHEEGWHSASGFKEATCASQDPAARLVEALRCVQAGGPMAGLTKCSTASNIRPTVLDYAAAFTQGACGHGRELPGRRRTPRKEGEISTRTLAGPPVH